jgi:hypothetical protein
MIGDTWWVAIDEHAAHRRARRIGRGLERAPAAVVAVRDAVVGRDQDVAARAERHRAHRAGGVVARRQAVAQIDRTSGVARQPPQVGLAPDPQPAIAIADHAADGLVGQPDIADAAPHAIAGAEHDAGAVARRDPRGVRHSARTLVSGAPGQPGASTNSPVASRTYRPWPLTLTHSRPAPSCAMPWITRLCSPSALPNTRNRARPAGRSAIAAGSATAACDTIASPRIASAQRRRNATRSEPAAGAETIGPGHAEPHR